MEIELPSQELYREIQASKTEYLLWDLTLYLRRESKDGIKSDDDRISLQVIYHLSDPEYNAPPITPCFLPINVRDFHGLIDEATELLQDYVMGRNTSLDNAVEAGQQFFQELFGTPNDEQTLSNFRTFLRARKLPLRILVIAEPDLQFPWNLLYVDNKAAVGATPVQGFLGARHTVVQQLELPFQRRGSKLQQFGSREHVHVSLQRDKSDTSLGKSLDDILSPLEQQKFVALHKRDAIDELLKALQLNECLEDFMYFCCHGGPISGAIQPSPQSPVCFWFDGKALFPKQFSGAIGDNFFSWQPMVFINSCHGGKIGRTYFESFVPLLLTSGASIVVGPTVAVAKEKALRFADELMQELFHGINYNTPKQETVADVVQRVRMRLLEKESGDLTPLLFQTAMRVPVHFARRLKRGVTNAPPTSRLGQSNAVAG